jgi:glutathione synthase/RimK-type ligase-like ATP-grasp enzyme
LHPADRWFAAAEIRRFREGSLFSLAPTAFWVNPPTAGLLTENKILQHAIATQVGFRMPDSLYTNNPQEIRHFLRTHGGRAVYKPLAGVGWSDGTTTWACHTIEITEAKLVDDHLLELTPGIYQELLDKSHEIRLTMVGNRPFAAKILSQSTSKGKLDWRRSYGEVAMEPTELPAWVIDFSCRLMQKLGIVFGCFDFIVTPAGDFVFLEVNQMGQFLFVEELTGLPITDALGEMLLQGSPDFTWGINAETVRYSEIREIAMEAAVQSLEAHPPAAQNVTRESRS